MKPRPGVTCGVLVWCALLVGCWVPLVALAVVCWTR